MSNDQKSSLAGGGGLWSPYRDPTKPRPFQRTSKPKSESEQGRCPDQLLPRHASPTSFSPSLEPRGGLSVAMDLMSWGRCPVSQEDCSPLRVSCPVLRVQQERWRLALSMMTSGESMAGHRCGSANISCQSYLAYAYLESRASPHPTAFSNLAVIGLSSRPINYCSDNAQSHASSPVLLV